MKAAATAALQPTDGRRFQPRSRRATLLSDAAGEFSANLYLRTPAGRGAISIYPAQQYATSIPNPGLIADLQVRRASHGFSRLPTASHSFPPLLSASNSFPPLPSASLRFHLLPSSLVIAPLQSLALKQSAGFDPEAQARLRSALPLKRTIELADGDLVLINTGRFHGVEPYGEAEGDAPEMRLSGQCWLSYQKGKALRMWV